MGEIASETRFVRSDPHQHSDLIDTEYVAVQLSAFFERLVKSDAFSGIGFVCPPTRQLLTDPGIPQ